MDYLRTVSLFSELDDKTLALIARTSHTIACTVGQIVFSQDEAGEGLYIVRRGRIDILLTTEDGRELIINEMRPGDYFGELALLSAAPRSATAVARVPSELIALPRDEFMSQLESQPRLMHQLLGTLSNRLRASSERESALAFVESPARLAHLLLQGERDQNEGGLVALSQEEIAARLGVTRQTVARTLGAWRRAGWILTGRGKIVILDRSELKRAANGAERRATRHQERGPRRARAGADKYGPRGDTWQP
jgi:CRP-like cAMP-binding protein